MSITSSFLYHFTGGKLAAIQGILQTGYRISFSDEIEYFHDQDGSMIKERRAIPMICFCDLPISQIRSHAHFYSNSKSEIFGFGMTRSWAEKNGINPIIYVSPQSYMMGLFNWINNYLQFQTRKGLIADVFHGNNKSVLESLPHYADFYSTIQQDDYNNNPNVVGAVYPLKDNNFEGMHKDLSRFELFYKPTHGIYHRGADQIPDHPYYFEREWRFIPKNLPRIRVCEEIEIMDDQRNLVKSNYENFLAKRPIYGHLAFSADDIDQIIVDNQESVEALKAYISDPNFKSVCGNSVEAPGEKDRLIAKILAWTAIEKDVH